MSVKNALKTAVLAYLEIKPNEYREQCKTQEQLLEKLQNEIKRLKAENDNLQQENAKLTHELNKKKQLEFIGGGYYLMQDDGTRLGPICPKCYAKDSLIFLLYSTNGGSRCSICGDLFTGVKSKYEGYKQQIF